MGGRSCFITSGAFGDTLLYTAHPSTVHCTLGQLPSQRSLTALAPEVFCPPTGHMWETMDSGTHFLDIE